ncbi:MAG: sulfite exporter TauE/SafE family protein [Betaproteobacteria bacterium]|nr:MAG: sulfite exporter TauE/SafE family protein [Betaproteobacteria bacterium]
MTSPVDYLAILALGLVAGTISGIVGFGSSIMVMPALVILFGPQRAVPIMATASIMANLSRILVWWREVEWRACAAYATTAAPAAALGARTLLLLPPWLVEAALGVFFVMAIPARRALAARGVRLSLGQLAGVGALAGYLTGIVASTGPITAPLFLARGLVKGAFLSTEAASSLAVYVSKAVTFGALGALPSELLIAGIIVGSSLMAGAVIARRFVLRLEAERFRLLMDGLLLVSGLTMLWAAWPW